MRVSGRRRPDDVAALRIVNLGYLKPGMVALISISSRREGPLERKKRKCW